MRTTTYKPHFSTNREGIELQPQPVDGYPEWTQYGTGSNAKYFHDTETCYVLAGDIFTAWNPYCERYQNYTKLEDAIDFASNSNPHNNYNIFTN